MKKLTKYVKTLSILLVAGLLFSSAIIPVRAFIQKDGTVNETVILRQNPDNASSQIKELSNGQSVTVNNELPGADGATWYQVLLENGTIMGYVPANTITISSGSSTTGFGTTTTMQTVTKTKKVGTVTAASAIRVREQATTSSEQIASLQSNAKFNVLSEVTAADGYVWYEAEFDDNGTQRKGYVRSDLVKVEDVTYEEQIPVEVPTTTPSESDDAESPYSITSQVNAEGTTVWYLMDNHTGEAKEITSLLTAQQTKSGGGAYKVIVVILLILLILAAAAATFFYMRWQDAEEFIVELREKQARARRQSAPITRPTPAKQPATKQAPQTKLPQGINEMDPKTVAKSVPSYANPVMSKPESMTASKPVRQPAEKDFMLNTSDIVAATKQELQNNRMSAVKTSQSDSWKSKNFLTDDDDLEFDFLDMDDN